MKLIQYVWKQFEAQDEETLEKAREECDKDNSTNVENAKLMLWLCLVFATVQVMSTGLNVSISKLFIYALYILLAWNLLGIIGKLRGLEGRRYVERIESAAKLRSLRTWRIAVAFLMKMLAVACSMFLFDGYFVFAVASFLASAFAYWSIYFLSVASKRDIRMAGLSQ